MDLLARLVAHQVVDLLRVLLQINRRHLAEPRKCLLPGNPHHELIPLPVVAVGEFLQGRTDQLVPVRIRLRQNLGMVDHVERNRFHLTVVRRPQLDRLEPALSDINTPDSVS